VEHAEIFWSLFAVDMDATLEAQPPDTWDSFPLFQLLNDYLRTDGKKKYYTEWSAKANKFDMIVMVKVKVLYRVRCSGQLVSAC
jgi:hypothetical protein